MRHFLQINILLIVGLFSLNTTAAVKVVECEDEQGNRSFQKVCPPGSTMVSEKKLATGKGEATKAISSSSSNIQATLYFVPDCEACDEVKSYLKNRNISITEKNASEDVSIQKELTELTGTLKVPVVVIGEKTITGYNRSELKATLENAGYKEEES
jgi:glutaredoxin